MPDRVFIARLFLISGGVLAVGGMILWYALPIPGMFPPYLVTALLALGYGVVWNCRRSEPKLVKAELPKPEVAKPEAAKPEKPKVEKTKFETPKVETPKPEAAKP